MATAGEGDVGHVQPSPFKEEVPLPHDRVGPGVVCRKMLEAALVEGDPARVAALALAETTSPQRIGSGLGDLEFVGRAAHVDVLGWRVRGTVVASGSFAAVDHRSARTLGVCPQFPRACDRSRHFGFEYYFSSR